MGFDCAPQFAALLDRDVIRLPSAGRNFAAMAYTYIYFCGQLYELFSQLAAGAGAGRAPQPDYVGRAINYIEVQLLPARPGGGNRPQSGV